MSLSGPRLTLPDLFREANSSEELMEKFAERLFRDLVTLTVLQHACIVFKWDGSKEYRAHMQEKMLNETERITKALKSVYCGNYTSPIADATVLQLSSHATITLRRLRDDAEG